MAEKILLIKELHQDPTQKYQLHGTRIEQIWWSFGRSQQEEAIKVSAAVGRSLHQSALAGKSASSSVLSRMLLYTLFSITELNRAEWTCYSLRKRKTEHLFVN